MTNLKIGEMLLLMLFTAASDAASAAAKNDVDVGEKVVDVEEDRSSWP